MFGGEGEKRIPVTMTLASGEIKRGSVPSGASASLSFELNREGNFLNFKDSTGQIVYIAKSTVLQVVEGSEEKKAALPDLAQGKSPHKVLRVAENASPDAIRQAYMALAKLYHPDHYATETTAPEVSEYVSAMFQQITVAYASLKAAAQQAA
jgi:DnaJ-domain-containing protein 1